MRSNRNDRDIPQLERQVLTAFCDPERAARPRRLLRSLERYRWADEENRIVYHALSRCKRVIQEELRERLSAETTRMGFPDVEWRNYFPGKRASRLADSDLAMLVKELLSSSGKDPTQP